MTRASDGTAARPISAAEAAELFSSFAHLKHVLFAVSGGPDSVAMIALARDWKKTHGRGAPKFSVATVDHGFRKEAREEANMVARLAKSWRMPHATLVWYGPKPKSGLQEKARAARYDLLLTHAHKIGAEALVLAHHADDQAETLLMRLASGSGITGLTGMKETTRRDEILILRPLLRLPAMRLRATVDALAIPYVDDPSNQNDAFQRVRLRKARAVLRAEGLTSDRLAIFAKRMARADDALKILADRARRSHEMPFEMGHMFAPTLFDEPHEIILRVLHASILQIGSGSEPMLYRLEDHVEDLVLAHSLGKSLKLTLGGAILAISADGRLKITSESPRRKV